MGFTISTWVILEISTLTQFYATTRHMVSCDGKSVCLYGLLAYSYQSQLVIWQVVTQNWYPTSLFLPFIYLLKDKNSALRSISSRNSSALSPKKKKKRKTGNSSAIISNAFHPFLSLSTRYYVRVLNSTRYAVL